MARRMMKKTRWRRTRRKILYRQRKKKSSDVLKEKIKEKNDNKKFKKLNLTLLKIKKHEEG